MRAPQSASERSTPPIRASNMSAPQSASQRVSCHVLRPIPSAPRAFSIGCTNREQRSIACSPCVCLSASVSASRVCVSCVPRQCPRASGRTVCVRSSGAEVERLEWCRSSGASARGRVLRVVEVARVAVERLEKNFVFVFAAAPPPKKILSISRACL